MAREPLPKLTASTAADEGTVEAPTMFGRPTDAFEPLPSVAAGHDLTRLRQTWGSLSASGTDRPSPRWRRLLRRWRDYIHRGLGNPDRELIADLIRSVDAVAARCDELAERVANQHAIVADVARIFGEDLTRLRADVAYLVDQMQVGPSSPADTQ